MQLKRFLKSRTYKSCEIAEAVVLVEISSADLVILHKASDVEELSKV